MRIFQHANLNEGRWHCPICKISIDKPVVLISIMGTEQGNNMEAEQIHIDCIELSIYKNGNQSLIVGTIGE